MTIDTTDRVRAHTAPHVNARIDDRARDRLLRYSGADDAGIAHRLARLDREWDIERYLEVLAPSLSLSGLALGVLHDRRWLALPAVVLSFLLQHATQGWCPPVPVLRRLGVRTRREIEQERYALKALRGDFDGLGPATPHTRMARVDTVLDAMRD